MPDIAQIWGNDLNVSSSGDLLTVDGLQLTVQRLVRRLMTRGYQPASVDQPAWTGEYIWHPTYGGSLPQRVGGAFNYRLITAQIQAQIFQEQSIAQNPLPVISFLYGAPSTLTVTIVYTLKATGQQQQLTFDVNV